MNLTDAFLRITLGTRMQPDSVDISGDVHIGRDVMTLFPDADIAWRARIISNGGDTTLNLEAGTLVPAGAPVHQIETATVTAAAGATASGNLALTLTGAHITGSPLAVAVPLVTGVHTTATLIADAIRAKLLATSAVTSQYTIGGIGAAVTLTRKVHFNGTNDATLNLAIAAGLGVTAAASSANTQAGVCGSVIERLGGSGLDLNGVALPAASHLHCLALFGSSSNEAGTRLLISSSNGMAKLPIIGPGGMGILSGDEIMWGDLETVITIAGAGILDVIFIGS